MPFWLRVGADERLFVRDVIVKPGEIAEVVFEKDPR